MPLLLKTELMLHKLSGKMQAGQHILPRKCGVLLQHIFNGIARRQKLQYRAQRNPGASNNRLPIADVGINKNAIHLRTEKRSNGDSNLFTAGGLFRLRLATGKTFYIFDNAIDQPIGL